LDSDLYTLDGYDGENFLIPFIKELYSLKYGMQVKGGKVN
jgi:putative transposase